MSLAIEFLNVNGLRGHFDEIKHLLIGLGIHILALIETKLDLTYPKELTGYLATGKFVNTELVTTLIRFGQASQLIGWKSYISKLKL